MKQPLGAIGFTSTHSSEEPGIETPIFQMLGDPPHVLSHSVTVLCVWWAADEIPPWWTLKVHSISTSKKMVLCTGYQNRNVSEWMVIYQCTSTWLSNWVKLKDNSNVCLIFPAVALRTPEGHQVNLQTGSINLGGWSERAKIVPQFDRNKVTQ